MRKQNKMLLVAGLLAIAFIIAAPTARADTYNLNIDGCTSPGCGLSSYGTVTVTQHATNQVEVNVTFASGIEFVRTGAGSGAAFGFSIDPDQAISISVVQPSSPALTLVSSTAGNIGFS